MPNNKKKRKNKEKKQAEQRRAASNIANAASTATAANTSTAATTTTAAAGPTPTPNSRAAESPTLRPCPHNPACCDECFAAYPSGCLHTLREDERNSSEMNQCLRLLMDALASSVIDGLEHTGKGKYSGQEEKFLPVLVAKPERMVRLCLHAAIKVIVGKESLKICQGDNIHEILAQVFACHMLHMYLILKQYDEEKNATTSEEIIAPNNIAASFHELGAVLEELYQKSYHRLVYTLNELSPCDCLKEEVERSRQVAEQKGEQELMHCFNPDCDKKESSSDESDRFDVCAGCKMVHYCSHRCYKDHWRGNTTATTGRVGGPTLPHKIACLAIQDLVKILHGAVAQSFDDDEHYSSNQGDDESSSV